MLTSSGCIFISLMHLLKRTGYSVKIINASVKNLENPEENLLFINTYTVPDKTVQTDIRLICKLPFIWERSYIYVEHTKERKTPILVEFPLVFESVITFKKPDDLVFSKETPGEKKHSDDYSSWEIKRDYKKGDMVIRFKFSLPARNYGKEDYEKFQESVNSALEETGVGIILEKT
jgi:hypothetical protein